MGNLDLGRVQVPLDQYASQGNAVLGIRGSGKSYSATYIAERMLDAGVPIVAFDPIGIWRFLRVPAKSGEGYKVVVAGGEHGDIPLPANGAAEIMRAAMRDGVSIVFDLYDIGLSKGDWRRVVESAIKVLLYENKAHGLRHVFLEEAAEFCPQRVQPDQGSVYSAIERLARMGGNAQLGYTLINQRAEEVNKAVLELCDLLILHRQKGRNSLIALGKWLDVAMVKGKIAEEVPALENGEAFVWPAGDTPPVKTKIPAKRTFHPDRKAMQKAAIAETKSADVSAFVESMRANLAQLTREEVENDPKRLKAELAKLRKAKVSAEPDPAAIAEAEKRGYALALRSVQPIADRLTTLSSAIQEAIEGFQSDLRRLAPEAPAKAPRAAPAPLTVDRAALFKDSSLSKAERLALTALAQYPQGRSHVQVALLAGYSHSGGGFKNALGALRTAGRIEGTNERLVATTAGLKALGNYAPLPTGRALLDYWMRQVSKAERKILEALAEAHPRTLTPAQIANRAGYEPDGGGFKNALGRLRTLELISGRGEIRASEDFFQ